MTRNGICRSMSGISGKQAEGISQPRAICQSGWVISSTAFIPGQGDTLSDVTKLPFKRDHSKMSESALKADAKKRLILNAFVMMCEYNTAVHLGRSY